MPTVSDRLRRIQRIFDDALARAPEERAAFVSTACGGDGELRTEVESLLARHENIAPDFMRPAKPSPDIHLPFPPAGPDPLIGATVGKYHIKTVIAGGGMGTVYEAVQEQPHRVVALKVMRHNVASRSALRRFEHESQVLARLRHPNIAQVYEAGTHQTTSSRHREGAGIAGTVPYFAMEYVPDATTITRYAEQNKLTTRERLELFAHVCNAVHHGHRKGIIHRDLKPANILVDSTGHVKIIDFGVARSTDSDIAATTMHTDIGQLIGTLQYMSPEQCDADPHDIDTRSDVYALGVVLYELLCGQLPYDVTGATIIEAARTICENPPTPPSSINPTVRGDLEIIVLTALKKNRAERYESVAHLAQDIRRYLNREPIMAKPPTAWISAVRWVSRHPVIASTAASLALSAVITGSTLIAVKLALDHPHRIRLGDDGREARLISSAGNVLKNWSGERPGAITFAELVERPPALDGGKMVIMGGPRFYGYPCPGALCAFDVDKDLDHPLWIRRVKSEAWPCELQSVAGEDTLGFGVSRAALYDIFADPPGNEIVAIFSSRKSSYVIRIYSLAGELLYQMWHDGSISSSYWMGGAGLLVFVGLNNEASWTDHGVRDAPKKPFPHVVFAVRPIKGSINRAFLCSTPGDDGLSSEWYKCLYPPDTADRIHAMYLGIPEGSDDPGGNSVRLLLEFDGNPDYGVGWDVDASGNYVEDSRETSDSYKGNRRQTPDGDPRRLPDPDSLYLDDLWSKVSTSGDEVPPAGRRQAARAYRYVAPN